MSKKITLDVDALAELVDLVSATAIENIAQQVRDWQNSNELSTNEKATILAIKKDMSGSFASIALKLRKNIPRDSNAPKLHELAKSIYRNKDKELTSNQQRKT